MNITIDFLTGTWKLERWVTTYLKHNPDLEPEMIHATDAEIDEADILEQATYAVWQKNGSALYEHGLLRSFASEDEMAQYEIEFGGREESSAWHAFIFRNRTTGDLVKKGSWQIDAFSNPPAIDLSVWDYNITLTVKIISDRQIMLKELTEIDEMECYVNEIFLTRI